MWVQKLHEEGCLEGQEQFGSAQPLSATKNIGRGRIGFSRCLHRGVHSFPFPLHPLPTQSVYSPCCSTLWTSILMIIFAFLWQERLLASSKVEFEGLAGLAFLFFVPKQHWKTFLQRARNLRNLRKGMEWSKTSFLDSTCSTSGTQRAFGPRETLLPCKSL